MTEPRQQTRVDVTPGAHRFLDALGTASFTLACGCRIPPGPEKDGVLGFKRPGSEIECRRHGSQVVTRVTIRLTGWKTDGK